MKEIRRTGLLYEENDKLKKERYEGEFKDGKIERKGISYYIIMDINMKGDIKAEKKKEKEFNIKIITINMKEDLKMIKLKEKEHIHTKMDMI